MTTKSKEQLNAPEELKGVDDIKMSRTDKPEEVQMDVNFEKIENMVVYDEIGNKIRFGDIYKRQKTIIVFTRHFLCFVCKDYVEDLALIPYEYLQEADVRVVVIGPAPFKFIKDFKKVTGFMGSLYTDPEREIYKVLGLKEAMEHGNSNESKHIKQNPFMGVMRSVWRGMKYKEFQGDVKQQGGALILGPGNEIHYTHIDKNSADHTSINTLLEIAGVQQVSFPKDKRVQDL